MIATEKLARIAICFFMFAAFLTERSIIGNGALILIFLVFGIQVLTRKELFWSSFFLFDILFLVYCGIQNLAGIPIYAAEAKSRLITLIICFLFEYSVYNILLSTRDHVGLLKALVISITVSVIIGITINIRELLSFSERISNTSGIKIGNIAIGALNSVGIAWFSAIGLGILIIYSSVCYNKYFYTFHYLMLSALMLISGTRKTLLVIPLGIIPIVQKNYSGKIHFQKIIKYVFCIAALSGIGLWMLLKIPVLYDIVGYRIESLLIYRSTGNVTESSLNTRIRLAEIAVEAFKSHPITGCGLDNFKHIYYYGKYYSHNNFLEIAVNCGIIGFVLYYLKYVYLAVKLIKKIKQSKGRIKIERIYMLLILAVFTFLEIWQVTYFVRKSLFLNVFLLFMLTHEENNKENTAV